MTEGASTLKDSIRVPGGRSFNPDVLVLGFQELDLSTQALVMSTQTLREDAWTEAVFTALGDRSTQYTKVCFFMWSVHLSNSAKLR